MNTKPSKKPVVAAYPEAFKTQALVLEGSKPKHVIAKELGIGLSTLTKWVHRYRQHHGSVPSSTLSKDSGKQWDLEEENRRLKRENEILRQEREILKP